MQKMSVIHPVIREHCPHHSAYYFSGFILLSQHFFTTSYVSPAMAELDAEAKAAGLLLLNECGVDPGLDHMSAMKVT
jgi:hypothetical protein